LESQLKVTAPVAQRMTAPGCYRFGQWEVRVGEEHSSVRVPLPITMRSRQPGDRIRPRGMRGSRKIQDVLTELRVPATERDGYPLLCDDGGKVVALPGFRSAELPNGVPTFGVIFQRLEEC
jgi:tRNA(Ile)-lysidine synthetase-like protein